MDDTEEVARHYGRKDLERTILDALVASGKDPARLSGSDLAPVDEFHIGGREATIAFAAQIHVTPEMHLLDIGCGLGGASRFFAAERGCRVTGIDLTEDYVETARALARRMGLSQRVSYHCGNAVSLPFEPGTFDGAYMMHVGMNIEDKPKLFAEVRRALKTGGTFGIYDVMIMAEGELVFPLPCAASSETSFIAGPAAYRRDLNGAGFEILEERNRLEFARQHYLQEQARTAECGGLPPLGLHLLLNGDPVQIFANLGSLLERGLLAPVELICRAA